MIIDGQRSADRATSVVLAYYNAFNRSDWRNMMALLTDDVRHDVNQGETEIGHEAFAAFLERMSKNYREEVRNVVVMATQDGRRAAAEFTVQGEYLATDTGLPEARGQRYSLPAGGFFELRDGRICRVTTYYNLQDWISQVQRGAERSAEQG
jgi:steroid delta-isomerase-like uncharacterized protein